MCVCVCVCVCAYVPAIILLHSDILYITVSFTADITNLSMMTFKAVAQQLPVVLRQWFITLDRKAASLVEEYVS